MATQKRTRMRGGHFGRGPAAVRRRLLTMRYNLHRNWQPSVSQLGAAYVTMLVGKHPDSTWRLLLQLCIRSQGTMIDCYNCKNGQVRVEGSYVDCERCNGSMRLRSHGFVSTDNVQITNSRTLLRQQNAGWVRGAIARALGVA